MKAVVTGGLGQIGSHVAELLLARGDQVVVIDNLATGRREHLAAHPALRVVEDTIADKALVDSIFDEFRPDAVIHAAASYKDPDDWHNDALTNCVGGANIIYAAKHFGVGRFVYFQTALCYGLRPKQHPITLDHPRNPAPNSYAVSKTANEQYLEMSGLDFVTFRLANVVGPRNQAGPLPIFYQRLKDGKKCFVTKARRDFVFVGDLAKVVIRAIDGTGHGTYHFSSGTDISIQELYDAVVTAMQLDPRPQADVRDLGPDDVESILLDPARTFVDFGRPQFTALQTTVQAAVDYYREHGTLGEYTHLRLQSAR